MSEEKISRRDPTSPAATSGTVSWTDGNKKIDTSISFQIIAGVGLMAVLPPLIKYLVYI